jgi:hypothetical protein
MRDVRWCNVWLRFVIAFCGLLAITPTIYSAVTDPGKPEVEEKEPVAPPAPGGKSRVPTFNYSQVEFINRQIHNGWQESGFTSAALATDGEWIRRLFLDVLGRVPSVAEAETFIRDSSADKRLKIVNRLLEEEYVEEYAKNWTTLWTNILIGRNGGTEALRMRMIDRGSMQQSLRRALIRNMPYDRLVFEIVSASGVNSPEFEKEGVKYNGFVNFLTAKLEEKGAQATAKTSQIFLGTQVQCTQCHNHPFNEWKQNQFWELNAFFRQTKALRKFGNGRDIDAVELVNEDFAGEDRNTKEAVLFYELRNGLLKTAYPVFVDGAKASSNSGWVSDCDRRTELAKFIISSDMLGQAMVNRMWAHFLGYGFTKPIDDMGPHNPPSHPELLEGLAKDFLKSSYDTKQLIRWIVLSEPYALSSRFAYAAPPSNAKPGVKVAKATTAAARKPIDDPTLGEKPMFSHFYLRQMRAEELFNSLLVATDAQNSKTDREEQEKKMREWLGQFVIAFGTDENDETTTFNGSIPQSLMMWNGDLIKQATNIEADSFLHRIANDSSLTNQAKINQLYMAGLTRLPTKTELGLANELLTRRKGNAAAALQDVWWAVLNSNEFILNH